MSNTRFYVSYNFSFLSNIKYNENKEVAEPSDAELFTALMSNIKSTPIEEMTLEVWDQENEEID